MENTLLIGDHITVNSFLYKPHAAWEDDFLPYRQINRGDMVVFKWPGDPRQAWVKRCIGLPGDRFEIYRDQVVVNNILLDEPYAYYKSTFLVVGKTRDPNNKFRPRDYKYIKPGIENAIGLQRQNFALWELVAKTYHRLEPLQAVDPAAYRQVIDRLNQFDGHRIPAGFYLMLGDNRNYSYDSRQWGLVPRELMIGRPYWVWWSYGEDENTHQQDMFGLAVTYLRIPVTVWTRTHWRDCFRRLR